MDRIQLLRKLIQQEKEAEMAHYQKLIEDGSLNERRKSGICWYPVEIKEDGYGIGEYPFIIVKRTSDKYTENNLQTGSPVKIFRIKNNEETNSVDGSIQYVYRDEAKIVLVSDELPEWIYKSGVGLQLLFDQVTYRQMEDTLEKLLQNKNPDVKKLIDIAYGKSPSTSAEEQQVFYSNQKLNDSQQKAVGAILSDNSLVVVHGPPGTGKTTVLVEAIRALVSEQQKKVLVCAPSNAAVDHITDRIYADVPDVIRVGAVSRVQEKVYHCSLDHQINAHPTSKEIKKLKKQAAEYRRLASQYKRNFGREEREQRKSLRREAKQLMNEAYDLEKEVLNNLLKSSSVVTATLVGSAHRHLSGIDFDVVIIDEAAQALEPATWIPLLKGKRAVLAGDPFQLPPTVKSLEASKGGLSVTLMEHLLRKQPSYLLNTQYRMTPAIAGFSNQWFYDDKLITPENIISRAMLKGVDTSLEFIDTAGCSFDETVTEEKSYLNEGEAKILLAHLSALTEDIGQMAEIGIIAPYRGQVELLKELAEHQSLEENCTINTVDSFQGQEKDVIYVSLVRSNINASLGFLKDYRRMNVAMTRARFKLVLIGDSATLGTDAFYEALLNYVEKEGLYRTAWEFM